jgi:hypothetical protein
LPKVIAQNGWLLLKMVGYCSKWLVIAQNGWLLLKMLGYCSKCLVIAQNAWLLLKMLGYCSKCSVIINKFDFFIVTKSDGRKLVYHSKHFSSEMLAALYPKCHVSSSSDSSL